MATVELDIEEFRTWFPGLTEEVISDEMIEVFWEQVCEMIGNTDATSFAPYNPPERKERKSLLYYALCHMATLSTQDEGQPGRIQSASEGSVSASFDLIKANSATAQWWLQTKCGATYWTMTAKYRRGGRLYATRHFHPYG